MTKQELVSQLKNAKNNYILGLSAISLFKEEQSRTHLDKSKATFGRYKVEFKQVSNLLRNKENFDIAIKEFLKGQLRLLIKESFELIKNYCENSRQKVIFEAQTWYQFARIIRNALSHNFYFAFNKGDKNKLPVSWKGRTIDLSMDGQPLTLNFFGYVETWELFQEIENFALNNIV